MARCEGGKLGQGRAQLSGSPRGRVSSALVTANSAPWEKQGHWQLESRPEFWKDHSVASVQLRGRNIVTALYVESKKRWHK